MYNAQLHIHIFKNRFVWISERYIVPVLFGRLRLSLSATLCLNRLPFTLFSILSFIILCFQPRKYLWVLKNKHLLSISTFFIKKRCRIMKMILGPSTDSTFFYKTFFVCFQIQGRHFNYSSLPTNVVKLIQTHFLSGGSRGWTDSHLWDNYDGLGGQAGRQRRPVLCGQPADLGWPHGILGVLELGNNGAEPDQCATHPEPGGEGGGHSQCEEVDSGKACHSFLSEEEINLYKLCDWLIDAEFCLLSRAIMFYLLKMKTWSEFKRSPIVWPYMHLCSSE